MTNGIKEKRKAYRANLKKTRAERIRTKFDPSVLEDTLDPRRSAFASYYLNPESPYYGNARQSAIQAGYHPTSAKDLVSRKPEWLLAITGKLQRKNFIEQARDNIKKFVEMSTLEPVVGMFGPVLDKDGNPVLKENAKLMKIKQDTTHFVLEKLDPEFEEKVKDNSLGNTTNNVQFNYFAPASNEAPAPTQAEVKQEPIDPDKLIKEVHDSSTS